MTYPRSFLGLLLAGFTLVALPLVGALAYSAWNTERLAVQSRSAVFNASQAARASRALVDRISSIERQLRDLVRGLLLDGAQGMALNRTVEQEQGLYDLLTASPRAHVETAEITARID